MAYTYPAAISPDAVAVAAYVAARCATVTGTPAPPPAPVAGEGFLTAIVDPILATVGYQGQNDQAAGVAAYGGGGFINAAGFAAWAFTAPCSKTYLLHVDVSCWMAGIVSQVLFRMTVDGAAPGGQPLNSMSFLFNTLAEHNRLSFRVPLALTAGARSLQLQWDAIGGGAVQTDAFDSLCMTVTG